MASAPPRLEGDFLNYKKAIPESFRVTVKTARTDLLEVVERVSLIIDSKNNAPLRLTFRKDAIDFVCTTPLGKAADSCPCEGDGGDLEIGFNDHYLSDALKAAPADEINVCLNTAVPKLRRYSDIFMPHFFAFLRMVFFSVL